MPFNGIIVTREPRREKKPQSFADLTQRMDVVGGGTAMVRPGSPEEATWNAVNERRSGELTGRAATARADQNRYDDLLNTAMAERSRATTDAQIADIDARAEGLRSQVSEQGRQATRLEAVLSGIAPMSDREMNAAAYNQPARVPTADQWAAEDVRQAQGRSPGAGVRFSLGVQDRAPRRDLGANPGPLVYTREELAQGQAEGLDPEAIMRYGLDGARANRRNYLASESRGNPARLEQLIAQTGAPVSAFEEITGQSLPEYRASRTPQFADVLPLSPSGQAAAIRSRGQQEVERERTARNQDEWDTREGMNQDNNQTKRDLATLDADTRKAVAKLTADGRARVAQANSMAKTAIAAMQISAADRKIMAGLWESALDSQIKMATDPYGSGGTVDTAKAWQDAQATFNNMKGVSGGDKDGTTFSSTSPMANMTDADLKALAADETISDKKAREVLAELKRRTNAGA
jgi:hypothetical protein